MIEKRVKRAAQKVSKDMLRGHMPENKMVCPKDERICLLTSDVFWAVFISFYVFCGKVYRDCGTYDRDSG